jgi:hypothetical protein
MPNNPAKTNTPNAASNKKAANCVAKAAKIIKVKISNIFANKKSGKHSNIIHNANRISIEF